MEAVKVSGESFFVKEIGVFPLGSISLEKFFEEKDRCFNYQGI